MVDLVFVSRLTSVASGVGLLALGYRAVRTEKPSANSFAALLWILGAAALCGGVTTHAGTAYKLVWLVTTLSIPLALALFSFDYYGLGYVASRSRFAAGVTPAVLGALGGGTIILGTPLQSPGATAPVPALAALPAPVFDLAATLNQIGLYYTTAVILLAVALVGRTVHRYKHLDARLGPVVAFIGVWPWLAYVAMPQFLGVVPTEFVLTGIASGYTGSVLAAALAVGPLGLFESTPAAGNVGPETVLDSMDDAVLVVDDEDTLLRCNAVACSVFGTSEAEAVGGPLDAVVGCSLSDLPHGTTVELDTVDGVRQFEVTRSPITGRRGTEQGFAVVLRDVTRRRTREQRLEVLNRVLRHNLRNNASSIINRAELIADGGAPEDSAERIVDTTTDLVSVAERAREIEEMMTDVESETASLQTTVEHVVANLETEYPAVEMTTAVQADATAAVSGDVLETVLRNLVENAARHNDADQPFVVVSVDRTEQGVAVAVADNGPGIPEHERSVLEAGGEGQLEHGSGLGLWAVNWGVTRMGGTLSFDDNDPRGTVVNITLPAAESEEVAA